MESIQNFCLQLHITGRCNQKCKHCYHDDYENELLDYNDIVRIITQFKMLIEKYKIENDVKKVYRHINITGGEPFVRNDIWKIIEFLDNDKYFTYGILTNGSLIDDVVSKRLASLHVSNVQVSIDGTEENHDYIRGIGNYKQTFNAIDCLRRNGIATSVSFTANRLNYKDFPKIAKDCVDHDVSRIWSDRLVPIGNGKKIKDMCLKPNELMEYISIMKDVKNYYEKMVCVKTEISMRRSLQFLANKKDIYSCKAGNKHLTVDEKGNILPCRRMPIICGNVKEDNLCDVYFNNEMMRRVRNKTIPKECEKCRFKLACCGGARCISYAMCNDFNVADPFCPLIYYNKNVNITKE